MSKQNLWVIIGLVIGVFAVLSVVYWHQLRDTEAQRLAAEQQSIDNLDQALLETSETGDVTLPSTNPLDSGSTKVNPLDKTNPFNQNSAYQNPFE